MTMEWNRNRKDKASKKSPTLQKLNNFTSKQPIGQRRNQIKNKWENIQTE